MSVKLARATLATLVLLGAAGFTALGIWQLERRAWKLGGGYWVLAPFRTERGFIVLVNRGFVPPEDHDLARRESLRPESRGPTTITGLLRLTEPKGAFLHANDPAADRWYSRDVAAIAAARHLSDVAPDFIDADASATAAAIPGDAPIGGLTVVTFPNNHLLYALTWFGLASLILGAGALAGREECRLRQNPR